MKNIDKIIEMLDCNNRKKKKKKGIKLASKIKHLDIFIMPYYNKEGNDFSNSKNIWENCAKILSSKTDKELEPYIIKILEWLEDLNFPGALLILERLAEYNESDLRMKINYKINEITANDNENLLKNLNLLKTKINNYRYN